MSDDREAYLKLIWILAKAIHGEWGCDRNQGDPPCLFCMYEASSVYGDPPTPAQVIDWWADDGFDHRAAAQRAMAEILEIVSPEVKT
jgi:hypothetical protein